MKRHSGTVAKGLVTGLLVVALLLVSRAWATPTTAEQAKTVVTNWLSLNAQPLGASLGQTIKEVQTFADDSGNPLYYVVYLNPSGIVLVSGDDLVEPIIGFLANATTYNPSTSNPLGALVSQDVPVRVQQARTLEDQLMAAGSSLGAQTPQAAALEKWTLLENPSPLMGGSGISSVSDLRVAPFIQSHWSQTTTDDTTTGPACYNYYTPPYTAGDSGNYPCGCVATTMGQLMRYWLYPLTGVGTGWFNVYVDGATVPKQLRGGDGYGNAYDWTDMVLSPSSGASDTQRQAIGNLLYDAGVSVNMQYTADSSGATMIAAGTALVNVFGYSNAIVGDNSQDTSIPYSNYNAMINPNLHAKYPVLLGINLYGDSVGHAVVCDGYGYDTASIYHHLNMGWSGHDDAWYNLPLIYPSDIQFNILNSVVYNVYTSGSGEIIAGRVTDGGGNPVSGATVTATGGYTATTDAYGIYALTKVPSNSTFTVTASKTNYTFTSQKVTTGKSVSATSSSNSYACGNLWGVDFVCQSSLNDALDNHSLVFATSGTANWYGQSNHWYYGGSAAQSGNIGYGDSTVLQTTVTGPGVLTFYWASSSTPYYNRLTLTVDGSYVDMLSGLMDWAQKSVNISAGQHTVAWTYFKTSNVFGTLNDDCVWVDKVVYTRNGVKPILIPMYQLLLLQ